MGDLLSMERIRIRASSVLALAIVLLVVYDIGLRRGEQLNPATPPAIVSAKEFQLLGTDGKVRARLVTIEDRPSFVLYDGEKSTPRVLLGVSGAADPIFTLLDRDGRTPRIVADLTAAPVANSLAKTVRSGLHLYDGSGKAIWSAP